MLVYPKLTPITQNTFQISAFEGIDRRIGAGENTLFHTKNMSVQDLPVLSTRRGRKKVFEAEQGETITGIFSLDRAYMTTAIGGKTRLYYGDDFSSLTCGFTSNDDELVTSMLCFFDNKLCLFNLKTAVGEQTLLVSSVSTLDFPTRYEAPSFNDVTVFAHRVIGCRRRQLRACRYEDISNWNADDLPEDPTQGAFFKNFETKSDFTACTTYKNRAIFFTSDEMYELYGKDPTQFELVKIADIGCINRFALGEVDGALYFVSKEGVMRYSGTVPVMISDSLCDVPLPKSENYQAALGGSGRTVYVRFWGRDGNSLYTYNTETKLWSREDDFAGICCVNYEGRSFFASENALWELEKDYDEDPVGNDGADFSWEVVTQDIHHYCPPEKRSSRLDFYIKQQKVARLDIYAAYDGGDFELLKSVISGGNRVVSVCLNKREYQSIRIKICGTGEAQIHYISRVFSLGGRNK